MNQGIKAAASAGVSKASSTGGSAVSAGASKLSSAGATQALEGASNLPNSPATGTVLNNTKKNTLANNNNPAVSNNNPAISNNVSHDMPALKDEKSNNINANNNVNNTDSLNDVSRENSIPENQQGTGENQNISNNQNGSGNQIPEEQKPKKGDKVDTGKQIGDNGEIEDSSTKKTLKAVGRGAAAYFSGGQSIGADKEIANMKPVDKTLGVVSDQLDKVPGVEKVTKELDDAGLADGVNDALDVVGSAKNGDIKGTVESAKKLKKDGKKLKKYTAKKLLIFGVILSVPVFFMAVLVTVVFGPVLGGFLDVVETAGDGIGEVADSIGGFIFDDDEEDMTSDIVTEVEDFESLSETRQKIVTAAAMAVSAKIPYSYGSHPYNSGLVGIPTDGLDCAGFVQWALWTGLESNPGYLTTSVISGRIGNDFIQIEKSELKPGDIGLKKLGSSASDEYNHTGIYAGSDQWFHAAGGNTKQVVRNNYTGFTIFLRYKGVDG